MNLQESIRRILREELNEVRHIGPYRNMPTDVSGVLMMIRVSGKITIKDYMRLLFKEILRNQR
jgi:hypothetical protein